MATLETLAVADLKQVLKSKSLKRARGYVGRVSQGARNGRTLRAEIRGGRLYHVEVDVAEDGIHAICSCPYNWGGYCKHIGAVLLKWIEQPGSFTIEMPALAATNAIIETVAVEPPPTAAPDTKPFWLQKPYQTRREKDDHNLSVWLNTHRVQDLRQMAKQQGWPIKGTRKADIIQQMMNQMLQPGIALKNLISLDTEHRQVYDAIGLLYPGILFQEKYLASLAKHWGDLTQHKGMDAYVAHLCDVGLAISGSFDHGYWQKIGFIPNSLMRTLPPLLADRIPGTTLPEDVDSGLVLGQKRPFLQRLHQIFLLLEQFRPPLRPPMPRPRLEKFHENLQAWDYLPEEIRAAQRSNKFKSYDPDFSLTVPPPPPALPDEAIQRLAPIAGDETQLDFIYHLLLAAGLLQPGSPVTVWREIKEQFLRQNEAGQWAILARAYFAMNGWNEVWLALAQRPSLRLKRSLVGYYRTIKPEAMYETLTLFRRQVLQMLACLPDERWLSLRDVTDLLHPLWDRFDSWAWSPTSYGGDMRPDWFAAEDGRALDSANNKADWNKAQGAFTQQIIQGPLHWLGFADVHVEYGRLTAFRLHGLSDLFFDKTESVPLDGAALPEDTAVSPPDPASSITIDGIAIMVDPAAVSAQAHNYLDGIAILEEAAAERFIYRLNAAAVHQALEAGQTLAQMLNGWKKWLAIPMPDAIHSQLTAWQQAYGQVRLYEDVTIIELGDEYALAEMKAATSLPKHLIAEISPTLVIIPANAVDTLVAELEKAGYTPKQAER